MSGNTVKIDVPYFSQFNDIEDTFWQNKSCGIVCVKMILDFFKPENKTTLNSLLKEGILIDGYIKSGWIHEALVSLLRNHGVSAYRQEFKSLEINLENGEGQPSEFTEELKLKGIEKIKENLKNKMPVIVSVKAGFGKNEESHMMVLTGFDKDNFYSNDPQKDGEKDMKVDFVKFKEFWRPLVIFTA